MNSNLKYLGLIILLIVVIVFGALCSIDLKNMEEGMPVVFSTWGKKYFPVESTDADRIKKVINEYIVNIQESESLKYNEKWFSAEKIYLISRQDDVYYAYAWVYAAGYLKKSSGELLEGSGFSVPYVFTIALKDNEFVVDKAEFPNDGTYAEDMENMFPEKILNSMNKVQNDGTIDELQMDIQHQIADFYN